MAAITIKIDGLAEAIKRFDPDKFYQGVQLSFNEFGRRVETEAKQRAPIDEGHLKGAIHNTPFKWGNEITCSVNYASYLEFGTRRYAAAYVAKLPAQWQQFAAATKGKGGGSMDEFIQNIMAWVLRKGIGGAKTKGGNVSKSKKNLDNMQQVAYNIALNILRKGIKPQPFIYPAFNISSEQLLKDLNAIKL